MANFIAGMTVGVLFFGVVHLFYRHLMGNIIEIAADENWSARELKRFLEQ